MRSAMRRGLMLGVAAIGALAAGTALSSQKQPAPSNFSTEDLRLCVAATAYVTVDSKGGTKDRYKALFERFYAVTPNEDNQTIGYRSRMLKVNLKPEQVRKLADACRTALDKGKPFANPFPAQSGEAEFQRFLRDGDGQIHLDAFSAYDGHHCRTALGYVWSLDAGPAGKPYIDGFLALQGLPSREPEHMHPARTRMFKAQLTEPEIRTIADTCLMSMKTGTPFVNPIGPKGHQAALSQWLTANPVPGSQSSAPALATSGPISRPEPRVDPLIARCDARLERARAESTKDFRNAQKGVETFLKTGVRFGFSYIQDGCVEIDSGIREVNFMGCPATYANALQQFRSDYYIGMPDGSRLQCN